MTSAKTLTATTASIGKTFGLDQVPDERVVVCYPPSGHPLVPTVDKHHHFDRELLCRLLNFLNDPAGDAMYLTGPTGSGKTSGISQACARLNWPMSSVNAHGRMEFTDLLGHHALLALLPGEEPTMQFVEGPLVTAMRHGHVLVINEIDLMDPAELSGLNDVLEGRPLVIAENGGDVVKPHPMFRVVVTGNSAGAGDDTGAYLGVRQQNIAAMDRYRVVQVGYLPDEIEVKLLMAKVSGMPKDVADRMVEMANHIRELFTGSAEGGESQLSFPMSTRVLVRWGRLMMAYSGSPSPLQFALNEAFLNRAAPEEKAAISEIGRQIFGASWGKE